MALTVPLYRAFGLAVQNDVYDTPDVAL